MISACSTVVLTVITAYYAWQTRALTKEARDARELATLPVLTCTLTAHPPSGKRVNGSHGDVHGEFNTLEVRNVGTGPALTVQVTLEALNPEQSTLRVKDTTIHLGTMGIESNSVDLDPAGHSIYGTEDTRLQVRMDYTNIYGKQLHTVVRMQMEPGSAYPGQWQWSKKEEHVAPPGAPVSAAGGPP